MSELPGQILLQCILIALNAFFAASEIAVISLNSNKLRAQAEDGDKVAKKMLILVDEPTGFLSTIQIGITLAGFLGSAFAAENFAGLLTDWLVNGIGITAVSASVINTVSVVLVTLILSLFTLVFGELVPKRIAMRKAETLARKICGVILFLSRVLKPLVWFTSACTNGVLLLCGINPHDDEEIVSEEDIRLMVDASEEQGAIESMEREFIENIFEFNNIDASDVMIPRTSVTFIWADATKQEILDTISSSGFSRFPVCGEDSDDILGVLRTREFLLALNDEDGEVFDMKSLVFPAAFFPETIKADALFREMQKRNTQMCIIVDEYGGMSGIVTMEDLLEELVGNIYDESDKITQEISLISENTWRVAGDISLSDLDEVIGTELDSEELDYNTLGGYIFDHLGSIPQDGSHEELTADGLHIRIELMEDRHVEWATVTKLPPEETDDEDDDSESRDKRKKDTK